VLARSLRQPVTGTVLGGVVGAFLASQVAADVSTPQQWRVVVPLVAEVYT